MIEYTDIVKAVNTVLKSNFPNVNRPAQDIQSGFKKPAFFVQLIPMRENSYSNYSEKLLMINIHYFSEEKTNLDNLKMLDSLNKIFKNTLKIKDRTITLGEKSHSLEDNVLQFKFHLQFENEIEEIQEYDLMQNLNLNEEVN